MVVFNVQISLGDYRKINAYNMYKQPLTIFLTFGGILYILFYLLQILDLSILNFKITSYNLFIGIFLVLSTPLSIMYKTHKMYYSNKYLQEEIQWTITESLIKIIAQSSVGEFKWSNIYKIEKVNNWIVVYHDKIIANFIPVNAFKTKEDCDKFWKYVKINKVKS